MNISLLIFAFNFTFLILLATAKNSFEAAGNSASALSTALKSVTESLFTRPQIPFDVIIYKGASTKAFDIIDKIGKSLSGKILRLSTPQTLTQSALIFTQNEKDSNEFLNRTELINRKAKPLRFLFHINEKSSLEKLQIPPPSIELGHVGLFAYFITETKKEIQLWTLEWFTEKACHIQQEILISSFDKLTQEWSQKLEFVEKFSNFHNCTLNVISKIFLFDTIYFLYMMDKIAKLQVFERKIVEAIGSRGNFTPNLISPITTEVPQVLLEARNDRTMDEFLVTTLFWEEYSIILTTPASSCSTFQKVFLVFDVPVWLCIFGTIGGAFLTIFVVYRMPKKVQNTVFGEKVSSPYVNVIGMFFGLGQTQLPRKNFARIIFVTYIMFCFVIATAYHGEF